MREKVKFCLAIIHSCIQFTQKCTQTRTQIRAYFGRRKHTQHDIDTDIDMQQNETHRDKNGSHTYLDAIARFRHVDERLKAVDIDGVRSVAVGHVLGRLLHANHLKCEMKEKEARDGW